MRKTSLWVEPQATPEWYDVRVTRLGKDISIKHKGKSSTSRACRFRQYELDARRLGEHLGPGAYAQGHGSIGSKLRKSSRTSFYFYRHRDPLNSTHYFRDYSSTVSTF